MEKKVILLVEDNPDDEELTRLAFEECRVANKLVVVRDGQEALDYLFLTGAYADRDARETPQVILLDMSCQSWMVWRCCTVCAPMRGQSCCPWLC